MLVLVTGSRLVHVCSHEEIERAMLEVAGDGRHSLVVGDASGVDAKAAEIAHRLGWSVTVVPAQWDRYGLSAGPKRNQQMIDMSPDVCIAFPRGGRGTADCIRRASKACIPVYTY